MFWLLIGLALLVSVPAAVTLWLIGLHYYICWRYLHLVLRIFQEKPLFIIPRGQPVPSAEDITFPTTNGLNLRGCYLHCTQPRRGVILFGLEFGSNRWSSVPYCERLLEAGYDVFAFEPRNQGESDAQPGYDPLQWVTDYEVQDVQAALVYLKGRPDVDPRGVGFFGISKGGCAGLIAAATDPFVRCFLTDGIFGTYTTLVPYMRKWYSIYNSHYIMQGLIPLWYYGLIGMEALRRIAKARNCRFPHLEKAIGKLSPRPLFMIHGGGDTYIKPDMAKMVFESARDPKQFWLVDGAKHNQALHLVHDEYQRRVLEFFNEHLADKSAAEPAAQPSPELAKTP
ncbi:MAG: prolyl oligopeptidase family serine peptidase [Gemmataceae bacterium]|nr:prolyl oligopeptidase family serine peptidase [Gemmataceae bacterium]